MNSLYARYRESEKGFQEKYFAMLKAGGTKHHKELLKPFGLDATDPAFWQKGLSVIEGFIDEIEAMENSLKRGAHGGGTQLASPAGSRAMPMSAPASAARRRASPRAGLFGAEKGSSGGRQAACRRRSAISRVR